MAKIVGLQDLNFETKDGLVDGVNLFFLENPSDGQIGNGFKGIMAVKSFVSRENWNTLYKNSKFDSLDKFVNLECDFIYNKYGKITGIIL